MGVAFAVRFCIMQGSWAAHLLLRWIWEVQTALCYHIFGLIVPYCFLIGSNRRPQPTITFAFMNPSFIESVFASIAMYCLDPVLFCPAHLPKMSQLSRFSCLLLESLGIIFTFFNIYFSKRIQFRYWNSSWIQFRYWNSSWLVMQCSSVHVTTFYVFYRSTQIPLSLASSKA
jgi:hypothetical protein